MAPVHFFSLDLLEAFSDFDDHALWNPGRLATEANQPEPPGQPLQAGKSNLLQVNMHK
jgi:hypothetical protein